MNGAASGQGEILNLDYLAAEYAQKIVDPEGEKGPAPSPKEIERLANKALGVLREQGVYALMLFLASRMGKADQGGGSGGEQSAPNPPSDPEDGEQGGESRAARVVFRWLQEALKRLPPFQNESLPEHNPKKALEFYREKVLQDLYTMLLVRDLYERILIYARHGAKAAGKA